MTLTLFALACLLPLSLVSLALALWPGRRPRPELRDGPNRKLALVRPPSHPSPPERKAG